jgi:uncharacterized protein DUF1236
MKRTLLISVAALALTAGGNLAYSQGGGGGAGGNTPMANPASPSGGVGAGASGGASMKEDAAPGTKAPAKGAQDRAIPEKQKSTQQAPTTRQSSDDKAAQPTTKQSQDDKAGAPATRQSQDKGQPSTTQQSQGQKPGTATQQQTQSPQTGGSKQGAAAQGSGTMTSKSVSLTTEQKTTIRQTVLTSSAPRVTNVNFDIKVGTVVPRTVRIAPLPATIISIEPDWRGYMYFVYNDEIIVVEPRTLRIVAVLVV